MTDTVACVTACYMKMYACMQLWSFLKKIAVELGEWFDACKNFLSELRGRVVESFRIIVVEHSISTKVYIAQG